MTVGGTQAQVPAELGSLPPTPCLILRDNPEEGENLLSTLVSLSLQTGFAEVPPPTNHVTGIAHGMDVGPAAVRRMGADPVSPPGLQEFSIVMGRVKEAWQGGDSILLPPASSQPASLPHPQCQRQDTGLHNGGAPQPLAPSLVLVPRSERQDRRGQGASRAP